MASRADLYTFQAMVWMYTSAAMQRCAVLRPGGDGSSAEVVHFGHNIISGQFRVVVATPSYERVRECVWLV